MKLLAVVVCFALLVCGASALTKSEVHKLAHEKHLQMLEMSKKRPLIRANTDLFNQYVTNGPRPYSVVAFLTSHGGSCSVCDQVRPESVLLARAFENARYDPEDTEQVNPLHDVFFVEMDASRNYGLFQEMGLRTVPHIVFIKPNKSVKKKGWSNLLSDRLNINRGWTADDIYKMLGSRTDVRVTIERPPEQADWAFILLVLFVIGSTTGFFFTVGRPLFDNYIRNRWLFFSVAVSAYWYCISGGMYNVIREVPFMYYGSDGSTSYIHPSASSQWGFEGYLIGFLTLACSATLYIATVRVHTIKANEGKRSFLLLAAVIIFHALFSQMRTIYTWKNGGYRYGMVWG